MAGSPNARQIVNRQLLVTGVGYRHANPASASPDVFTAPNLKPNIGACVALQAVRAGYHVHIVARTIEKLENVRSSILRIEPAGLIDCHQIDVLDSQSVAKLMDEIPNASELDIVQSAGLSAGTFNAPGGSPFLPIDETPLEMATLEFESVVKSLLILIQNALPRLRNQRRSRLVVVSSMSGIRAFPFGFSHTAGKGGLHQALRSLSLELNPMGIRVCEVAPGIVNTGLYDAPQVDSIVRRISEKFDYHYAEGKLPQMNPLAVADAVMLCLCSEAHILSVSMVSEGQFPNSGS